MDYTRQLQDNLVNMYMYVNHNTKTYSFFDGTGDGIIEIYFDGVSISISVDDIPKNIEELYTEKINLEKEKEEENKRNKLARDEEIISMEKRPLVYLKDKYEKPLKYSKVFTLDDEVEILIQLAYADEEVNDTGNTMYCVKITYYAEDVIGTITTGRDTKESILQKIADFTEEKAIVVSSNLLKLYK